MLKLLVLYSRSSSSSTIKAKPLRDRIIWEGDEGAEQDRKLMIRIMMIMIVIMIVIVMILMMIIVIIVVIVL